MALCNPAIVWRSEEEETDFEGCLSIGEISVEVPRAVAIRVEAQDLEGSTFELEPEGFGGAGDPARDRPPRRDPHPRPHGARAAPGGAPRRSATGSRPA